MEILAKMLSKDVPQGPKQGRSIFRRSQTTKVQDTYRERAMLQGTVLGSARVALTAVGQRKMLQRGFDALASLEPVTARHALAIAADMALRDPEEYVKRVGPLLESNLGVYGQAGDEKQAE